MSLIGIGLLLGWFVYPLGYLLVAWGAWRLRNQTRLAPWLLVASVAAGLGQMAKWGTESAPWSFGAIAGVITEVLVCTILIELATSEGTRLRARFFRLALPVSYFVFALAWLPTHGVLNAQNFFATAAFVSTLVINLGLSVALAFLLLNARTNHLGEQAEPAHVASGVHHRRRGKRPDQKFYRQ